MRSLKFSRTKNDCSGDNSAASGSLILLTRTRLLASSRNTAKTRNHQSPTASLGLRASVSGGGAWPTALAKGNSSASKTNSSSCNSSAGVSESGVFCTRAMSRAIARCSGARRGCAARPRRKSAIFSADTKGSMLPVSCACCCARRTAASISTTRFSSRERERLCISSSTCARCSETSVSLTSVTASLAAVSIAKSRAWWALVLASVL